MGFAENSAVSFDLMELSEVGLTGFGTAFACVSAAFDGVSPPASSSESPSECALICSIRLSLGLLAEFTPIIRPTLE